MEFVALSDEALRLLCLDDPYLKRVFRGVYPEDRLPPKPSHTTRNAYIVNTDPLGEPGEHWLALWCENNECEFFDSYGLPIAFYDIREVKTWLEQWKTVWRSDKSLQAFNSNACGHYALLYLKAKSRGQSLEEFLSKYTEGDFVDNDRRAGLQVEHWILDDLKRVEGQQTCQTRAAVQKRKAIKCSSC